MNNGYKWFFTALSAGAGAYWLLDTNESVRNALAVLTFLVFALVGENETNKVTLRETNKRLWDEIKTLEDKIERLERDREDLSLQTQFNTNNPGEKDTQKTANQDIIRALRVGQYSMQIPGHF